MPKKGGLGQFVDLRGGLARKRGWGVFEEGSIPQCPLCCIKEALFFTYLHMILTKINQCIFSFETKNYAAIKQHIIKNLYLENLL